MSTNQQINSPSGATSPNGSQQSSPTTWTEPPWSGWIETTGDALLILEAARRGLIPRVTRRLVDSERKMITSGSVFVFDEDESGIKRWTDDKRGAGHRGARSDSVDDHHPYNDGTRHDHHSLSRPKGEASSTGLDRHRERVLVGSLTNSYKFKSDGLMKKTFSLTIAGVAQHLISYYKIEDVEQGRLRSPSSLPELASLDISPDYLDKTHFRNPPKVEVGVDGIPRYRGEADDIDPSPSLLVAPLSTGLPLLTDGRVSDGNKRGRYNPYGSNNSKRRSKGGKARSGSQSNSPTDNQATGLSLPSPSTPTSHHTQGRSAATSAAYPEQEQAPNVGVTTAVSVPPPPPPHYAPFPVTGYYGPPGVPGVPHPQQLPSPSVSAPVPPYGYSPPGSYTAPQPPSDPQQAVVSPPQPYYSYYLPPHPSHPHPHSHPHYGGYPATSWHTYNGYPGQAGQAPAPPTTTMSGSAAAITELPDKDGDTPPSGEVGGDGGSA
ncbi:Gti1/Pac2 family-domain-containing protein [Pisolithus marmoratus]|nr:Gti1/Pac2 family-domain-containing protein [Pisolithus marmoratus]